MANMIGLEAIRWEVIAQHVADCANTQFSGSVQDCLTDLCIKILFPDANLEFSESLRAQVPDLSKSLINCAANHWRKLLSFELRMRDGAGRYSACAIAQTDGCQDVCRIPVLLSKFRGGGRVAYGMLVAMAKQRYVRFVTRSLGMPNWPIRILLDEAMLSVVRELERAGDAPTWDELCADFARDLDPDERYFGRPVAIFPRSSQYVIEATKKKNQKMVVMRAVGGVLPLEIVHMICDVWAADQGCIMDKDENQAWEHVELYDLKGPNPDLQCCLPQLDAARRHALRRGENTITCVWSWYEHKYIWYHGYRRKNMIGLTKFIDNAGETLMYFDGAYTWIKSEERGRVRVTGSYEKELMVKVRCSCNGDQKEVRTKYLLNVPRELFDTTPIEVPEKYLKKGLWGAGYIKYEPEDMPYGPHQAKELD